MDTIRILTSALAASCTSAVVAQHNPARPSSPTVVAVPIGPQEPIFGPGTREPPPRPNHPPIDQIPPMPFPELIEDEEPGSEAVILYDGATGIAAELPVSPVAARGGGVDPGFRGVEGISWTSQPTDSFGQMFIVNDFENAPTRYNCKLVMRFVDGNQIDHWRACSGAIVDAGIVLTAGHCVYARKLDVDGVSVNIFDYAKEIYIYPGWNGVGTMGGSPGGTEIIQAWGWTRAATDQGSRVIVGADWVNKGKFNRDLAAIGVQRGNHRMVGMLTSGFGLAWDGGCNDIKKRTYFNYSYPAQDCGGWPGLHNGRDLYLWSGTFDSCPGNQLQIKTKPGCFTRGWGGMSGGNAFFIHPQEGPVAHAVHSNGTKNRERYCKVWGQFRNDLRNTLAPLVRGDTFDLEALRLRLQGSTQVEAGELTANSRFVAANATNADRPHDIYTVRIYLGASSNITANDTLLATTGFAWAFEPMQNLHVELPGVTIPPTTIPGTYWLGVILDPATDTIPANNSTITWDAQPITVLPSSHWGACCLPDGSCTTLTGTSCFVLQGVFQGKDTECATVNCPPPLGACCLSNGTCEMRPPGQCSGQGMTYKGNGTTCATVNCPPTLGACCMPDGACGHFPAMVCDAVGGAYQGDDTTCTQSACGACCLPGGSCIVAGPAQCASQGGSYQGPGTNCITSCSEQTCYANCDSSALEPVLNVDDFTCFINEFAAAQTLPLEQQITHYANCDSSTAAPVLNVDDFICFINAFTQGCP